MLRKLLLVSALLTVSVPVASADDDPFADTKITSTELGSGVWMLQGRGGNMLLVAGDGGALLVDDQFAPLTDRIVAAVAGLTDQPLKWVVNTHWHADHTGGNENLGKGGAIIVAHDGVHRRMSSDQLIAAFDKEVPAAPMVARPVVTFTETVTLHLAGRPVTALYVGGPAHTDGDSFVRVEDANVMHLGDVFFNGLYPFIDTSSGGNLAGVIHAAQEAHALVDAQTKIGPGHGPLADRKELADYVAMLVGVIVRPATSSLTSPVSREIASAEFESDGLRPWADVSRELFNLLERWSLRLRAHR